MKISVDEEKCIGAGQCVLTAPQVFDQRDDDGVVILLADTPPDPEQPAARDAAVLCPATAITVTED
jgi:ferredoxin